VPGAPPLAGCLLRCYEGLMDRSVPPVVLASAIVAGLLGGAGTFGCGTTSADGTQRLANGRYELNCPGALSHCLEQADEICRGTRFRVEEATDNRDYMGPEEHFEREVRTSHAIIHCGSRGQPLFGSDEPEPKTAVTKPASLACVPGATQSCVGSSACAGGQACLPDGSGFSPCDCGATSRPTSAGTPAAEVPAAPGTPPPSPSSAPASN
jgi:hypothetical protein